VNGCDVCDDSSTDGLTLLIVNVRGSVVTSIWASYHPCFTHAMEAHDGRVQAVHTDGPEHGRVTTEARLLIPHIQRCRQFAGGREGVSRRWAERTVQKQKRPRAGTHY
jgi:hypothetical protein